MIGKEIAGYKIVSLIGEGGMAKVFLAEHTKIKKKAAIKSLHEQFTNIEIIRKRFLQEAENQSKLFHNNIVVLQHFTEDEDGAYLILEYVDGYSLDEYIHKKVGPIPEEKAVGLFLQILEGIGYAHSKGIVHRDIKPSNIMITKDRERIKIMDFGIAKAVKENHNLTRTGTKLGTILYMSPEQVKGKELDEKTDIYSLGVVLFEMLTGKKPYDSQNSTEYEIYDKIVRRPLPRAKDIYPLVSDKMQIAIDWSTQKLPTDRFVDCKAFADYLQPKLPVLGLPFSIPNEQSELPVLSEPLPVLGSNELSQIGIGEFEDIGVEHNDLDNVHPFHLKRILFIALFLIVLIFSSYRYAFRSVDNEVVVISNVNIRKYSDTQSQKIGEGVFHGDKVQILEKDNFPNHNGRIWARIRKMGSLGWLNAIEGWMVVEQDGSKWCLSKEDFSILEKRLGNEEAQKHASKSKNAYLNYFKENSTLTDGWKVYEISNKDSRRMGFYVDLDMSSEIPVPDNTRKNVKDFIQQESLVVIIQNKEERRKKLVVFSFDHKGSPIVRFEKDCDDCIYLERITGRTNNCESDALLIGRESYGNQILCNKNMELVLYN